MLLNARNGTLDLRTGKLRSHSREDFLTKFAPVNFDPDAKCPEWMKFLGRIFAGDAELISFVRKAIGYTLTGKVTEKAMFFFHGSGNNGKTTLLEVIRKMLGEYAGLIDIDALMSKAHTAEKERAFADLLGKRFVTSSAAGEGQAFHEARVKYLTGMGRLVGRRIYGSAFEFDRQFKLFIDANHKPAIRGSDDAIWNRLRLVPFNVAIPEAEQDKQLGTRLAQCRSLLCASGARQVVHGAFWNNEAGMVSLPRKSGKA